MPRLNGKFVSQKRYDEYMAEQSASEESNVTDTEVAETTEKRTRQADPLLAAKRRLEAARKAHAKVAKKKEAIDSIEAEWEAVNAELEAATEAFKAEVENV